MDERIYGLLGRKLGHSWSVPIHAALGNGAYRLLELEPDGLAPFLHRKDIGGLNVTIPYKRDVMPLCDEIDPAAEAIGSVNTLVRQPDGKLVIVAESNAGNPMTRGLKPLLTVDVWEHAYYIDYRNRRAEFVKNWWDLVDWQKVADRL